MTQREALDALLENDPDDLEALVFASYLTYRGEVRDNPSDPGSIAAEATANFESPWVEMTTQVHITI